MGLGSRFWRTYQVDHKGHLQIKDLFGQAADIPLRDSSITTSYGTGVTGLLRKAFKLGTVSIAGSAGHFTCEHIRNPAGFAEILKARALQNLDSQAVHPLDNQGKLVVRRHKPLWEYAVNFIVFGTTLMVPAYLTEKIIKTASISGGEATPAQAEKIKKMTPEELEEYKKKIFKDMPPVENGDNPKATSAFNEQAEKAEAPNVENTSPSTTGETEEEKLERELQKMFEPHGP